MIMMPKRWSKPIALKSSITSCLYLSDVNSAKLRTRQGKEDLQKQLKEAVNAVLEKRAGKKDAIDDVYFTKLLMQ